MQRKWTIALTLALAILVTGCGVTSAGASNTKPIAEVVSAPQTAGNVDPGTPLGKRPAPNFTLTNQFGKRVSLAQYRGKVVILAFMDSQCTTICPLTSEEMVMAKHMLGPKAASQVALLAVDANPAATSVSAVYNYTKAHGVLHQLTFVTGSRTTLEKVWKHYSIYVAVVNGAIDHTPGVYIIDPQGRERRIYMTQMAYAGLGQQSQVFAQEVARLLPHPTETSKAILHQALVQESVVHSLNRVMLPTEIAAGTGPSVTLGTGKPRLLVFFASWLSELSNVPQQLALLNQYQRFATAHHLPSLTAIDEAPTEPSPTALSRLLKATPSLDYPVAVDTTGAVADQVNVQDLTWYALINAQGKVIWSHDGSDNWLQSGALETFVSHAMTPRK